MSKIGYKEKPLMQQNPHILSSWHGPPTMQAMQRMQEKLMAWPTFMETPLSNCRQKCIIEGKIPVSNKVSQAPIVASNYTTQRSKARGTGRPEAELQNRALLLAPLGLFLLCLSLLRSIPLHLFQSGEEGWQA